MLLLTLLVLLADGCAVSKKTKVRPQEIRPALEATEDQLIAQYNQIARGVRCAGSSSRRSPRTSA